MLDLNNLSYVLTLGQDDKPPTQLDKTEGDSTSQSGDGTTEKTGDAKKEVPPQGGGGGFGSMMLPMLLIIGVFFFMMMGGQRREKKKRAALLASLRKGDKVQSIGGIRGTVVEVRDSEVVLKVDENSNTRMRFAREAIQGVVGDRPEREDEDDQDQQDEEVEERKSA